MPTSEDGLDWSSPTASPFGSLVSPEMNQGQLCISSWAFAAVGAVESRLAIKHQQALIPLSVQQVYPSIRKQFYALIDFHVLKGCKLRTLWFRMQRRRCLYYPQLDGEVEGFPWTSQRDGCSIYLRSIERCIDMRSTGACRSVLQADECNSSDLPARRFEPVEGGSELWSSCCIHHSIFRSISVVH